MADGWGVRGTTREGEWGVGGVDRSVVEATIAQLLVDPLADARHVLLAEEQRLLHREAAAVLASTHKGGVGRLKVGGGGATSEQKHIP